MSQGSHRNIPFLCAYTSRQTRPLFGRRNPDGKEKKTISCGASDLLTFTWNNGLQFEIQKLCTIKKKRSLAFLPLQWMGPVHRCACDRVGADNGTSHRGPGHLHRAPLQAEWCVGLNRWVPPLQNKGREKKSMVTIRLTSLCKWS